MGGQDVAGRLLHGISSSGDLKYTSNAAGKCHGLATTMPTEGGRSEQRWSERVPGTHDRGAVDVVGQPRARQRQASHKIVRQFNEAACDPRFVACLRQRVSPDFVELPASLA